MKNIKIIGIVTFLISMLACKCSDEEISHLRIKVVNLSTKDIVYQILIDPKDTTYDCSGHNAGFLFRVAADSSGILEAPILPPQGWEVILGENRILNIFMVDEETSEKYVLAPCDTVHKFVPILHRYQLTLKDLQRMNWIVVYPPKAID